MAEHNGMTAEQVEAMVAEFKKLQAENAALQAKLPKVRQTVEIVDYVSKGSGESGKYVKTAGFKVLAAGKEVTARGLFLRVEAIDQAIEALNKARELLK